MTADETVHHADRLIVLTRAMTGHARRQDWDALELAEEERETLIRHLFSTQVPPAAAAAVAARVRDAVACNRELIVLAEGHRDAAGRALREQRTGRRAADAYRNASS